MVPSSWSLFVKSIFRKSYSKEKIIELFDKSVSREDFSKSDRVDLINYAFSLQKKAQ